MVKIMKSNWRMILLLVMILLSLSGNCLAADKISVFVSIVPQQYFVQQIGKELIDVQVMVQPGASPATYEPKPKQMADLSKAKIYFAIGVPFENAWLDEITAANPNMQVVHTDNGIEKLEMIPHHHDDHEGEHHEAEHEQEKKDCNLWYSIQPGDILRMTMDWSKYPSRLRVRTQSQPS